MNQPVMARLSLLGIDWSVNTLFVRGRRFEEAYLYVINWETGLYSDCTRWQKNIELMDDVESILKQIAQFEAYGGPRMTFESWWVHDSDFNSDSLVCGRMEF
jgi:hypothetical protein